MTVPAWVVALGPMIDRGLVRRSGWERFAGSSAAADHNGVGGRLDDVGVEVRVHHPVTVGAWGSSAAGAELIPQCICHLHRLGVAPAGEVLALAKRESQAVIINASLVGAVLNSE